MKTELMNDVQKAIALRMKELQHQADHQVGRAEWAKLSAAGCFLAGAVAGLPLSPVIAGLGIAAYAGAVFLDWKDVGDILPLPFYRLPLGVSDDPSNPITRTVYGLPLAERYEYQLLAFHQREIVAYLAQLPPGQRESTYQALVNETIAQSALPETLEQVKACLDQCEERAAIAALQPAKEAIRVEYSEVPQTVLQPPETVLQVESEPDNELPPIRDLAKEMAQYDGHIALVSKTRSGKTTLMIGSIHESLRLGHQVVLIDGKGDERLRAITGIKYLQCNRPERVAAVFAALDAILNELARRQEGTEGQPISIYIDEFNLVRDTVMDADDDESKGKDKAILFSRQTKRILLQGAAAQIYLRASSHTSRVEDWGWNTGVLDSVSFLAMGRIGAYESIEDLIHWQLKGRKSVKYQEDLDLYRTLQFDEPLALTTLHPMGFYRIPKVEYSAPVQTDRPLPDYMQKIVEFSQRKGAVNASAVKAGVRACRDLSVEDIRLAFDFLAQQGMGEVDRSGADTRFNAA